MSLSLGWRQPHPKPERLGPQPFSEGTLGALGRAFFLLCRAENMSSLIPSPNLINAHSAPIPRL